EGDGTAKEGAVVILAHARLAEEEDGERRGGGAGGQWRDAEAEGSEGADSNGPVEDLPMVQRRGVQGDEAAGGVAGGLERAGGVDGVGEIGRGERRFKIALAEGGGGAGGRAEGVRVPADAGRGGGGEAGQEEEAVADAGQAVASDAQADAGRAAATEV